MSHGETVNKSNYEVQDHPSSLPRLWVLSGWLAVSSGGGRLKRGFSLLSLLC